MKITPTDMSPTKIDADAVVLGLFSDGQLDAQALDVDAATEGVLTRMWELEEIKGQLGEVTVLWEQPAVRARQVVVTGLGEREEFDSGVAFRAAGAAAKMVATKQRQCVAFYLGTNDEEQIAHGICGAMVGCRGQDLYRTEKTRLPIEQVLWHGGSDAAIERGKTLGESVNLTRRLVNEPASVIYPASFAAEAEKAGKQYGFGVEVWDEDKLDAERCGALLGVARGSEQPPRLVIMRHDPPGAGGPLIALVGKGVTFDSGGLSLKPSDGMKAMKCDMAGAATVLGAMCAIARLKIPARVIGLAGLVENMVSGDSYKLGDVLTARSGKTIEVLNTDAEGRLVLADVLDVANEQGADRIIDLATLTGACLVALGTDVAGLMTNDQQWCDQVQTAASACGEPVWQLPMFAEFGEQIKSDVADIKNIGEGRWGGAITAAKLLEEFVGETPWVHIDIAGPAFLDKPKSWQDAGGSGAFVRTLVSAVESL